MRILTAIALILLFTNGVFSQKTKLEKGIYAKIVTDKGEILLQLLDEKAPLTVANFVGLAEGKITVFDTIKIDKPFYNGVTFHRVIDNFMIQGGDPTGTGAGSPGYKFWDETNNGEIHEVGTLSMANSGPNTNGSQFFITHVQTPWLNGKHTVFGRVLEGQDVVNAITQGDVIKEIKIIRIGSKYKKFNATKVFKKEYDAISQLIEKERLVEEKQKAMNKVRFAEAKAKSEEEYKEYFYGLIKEMEPTAKQTPSGLVYVVREEGTGDTPEEGDKVSLHYLGTLLYGGKFDSSYDRNQPLDFNYLVTQLIPGFNEGVGISHKGEKIDLYIPYFLAYGINGRPPQIPPYADLIFSLEILNIEKP